MTTGSSPFAKAKAAMQRAAEATIAGDPAAVELATEALELLAAAEEQAPRAIVAPPFTAGGRHVFRVGR